MKKVILAFWNRWHVMQGLTKVGSGNLKTNPRFPGAQNQEKWAIWQTDPVKLHPNFGQPWEAAWVPVTDGLPFRSPIVLERSDAWLWLWLGRRSPSMCPHGTGTWIAACGFQGQPRQSMVQTVLASAPIDKCVSQCFKGPRSSAPGIWILMLRARLTI